ncbi:MAG: ComF family protein [Deltaproteobacteria bacterium]|nr:ComF family protein [Deltaproteobacteria bacterium]
MICALFRGLLDGFFPSKCASCGALGASPFCAVCSVGLLEASPLQLRGTAHTRAVFEYGGPIARAIWRLKYDGRIELGRTLGRELRPELSKLDDIDVVVPIPLSPARLKKRGYNQARELAVGLDAGPLRTGLRRRDGPGRQVGRARADRWAHARGAFSPIERELAGRHVLLVDDVITTGATLEAAAKAATEGGARSVQALALARAEARAVGRRSDDPGAPHRRDSVGATGAEAFG